MLVRGAHRVHVVAPGSRGTKYKDSGMTPYGTSKVLMMLFARELSIRAPELDVFCVHPGEETTVGPPLTLWRRPRS